MMLDPKYVILDETDNGLDIDALHTVASAINSMGNHKFSAIIITDHSKLLEYIKSDFVHIISDGKIAMSRGLELIDKIEKFGYEFVTQEDRP
jgi:Fe-S cluster assembly ATP-binding protein